MLALLALPAALGYATCAADFPAFNATTASSLEDLQLRVSQNDGGDVCVELLADLSITSHQVIEHGRLEITSQLHGIDQFLARMALCAGVAGMSDGAPCPPRVAITFHSRPWPSSPPLPC